MASTSIKLHDALQANWPVFSVAQSRDVDRLAIEQYGIPGIDLMRHAGTACARRLQQEIPATAPPTMILTGGGNNGGDGYVIAQSLAAAGRTVRVISLVPISKLSGDARISHNDAVAAGIEITQPSAPEISQQIADHDGMIIDCLLGTGSQGAPRPPFSHAIIAANQRTDLRRVAIDLPSGLDGDSGEAHAPTFQADLTLTFVAPKIGIMSPAAREHTGEIEIIDIGIPLELKRQFGIPQ